MTIWCNYEHSLIFNVCVNIPEFLPCADMAIPYVADALIRVNMLKTTWTSAEIVFVFSVSSPLKTLCGRNFQPISGHENSRNPTRNVLRMELEGLSVFLAIRCKQRLFVHKFLFEILTDAMQMNLRNVWRTREQLPVLLIMTSYK